MRARLGDWDVREKRDGLPEFMTKHDSIKRSGSDMKMWHERFMNKRWWINMII